MSTIAASIKVAFEQFGLNEAMARAELKAGHLPKYFSISKTTAFVFADQSIVIFNDGDNNTCTTDTHYKNWLTEDERKSL